MSLRDIQTAWLSTYYGYYFKNTTFNIKIAGEWYTLFPALKSRWYSSGKTTKLSLQNLPPDDCLRFVMKQETECGAAL